MKVGKKQQIKPCLVRTERKTQCEVSHHLCITVAVVFSKVS